ncbi:MAG: outer membrane lipoprotein-sorting protein [Gammaproteobacteria bacterium]|nr:outer membrane lipoprotein-sorting protein [Gammaproteobacteria bacterium]
MNTRYISLFLLCLSAVNVLAAEPSAEDIILAAINYERDATSYSQITMNINRPDWQRSMTMKSWTKGLDHSLVRVVKPKKDAGSGNLLIEDNMWSYAPKINRVIKLPSSMMNQSWMGSDFSNNDLAKADDIINQYQHKLLATESHQGKKVYVIESIPNDEAPVVWGKEVLKVRADYIMLSHEFYDQDGKLVKRLISSDIKKIDGKTVAARIRMQKVEKPEEWTEVIIDEAKFGISIPDQVFSLSNLRNPRQGY